MVYVRDLKHFPFLSVLMVLGSVPHFLPVEAGALPVDLEVSARCSGI